MVWARLALLVFKIFFLFLYLNDLVMWDPREFLVIFLVIILNVWLIHRLFVVKGLSESQEGIVTAKSATSVGEASENFGFGDFSYLTSYQTHTWKQGSLGAYCCFWHACTFLGLICFLKIVLIFCDDAWLEHYWLLIFGGWCVENWFSKIRFIMKVKLLDLIVYFVQQYFLLFFIIFCFICFAFLELSPCVC